MTTVFTSAGGTNTPTAFTTGFRPALTVAAGLSLLGVCTALALRGRRARAEAPDPNQAPTAQFADAGRPAA